MVYGVVMKYDGLLLTISVHLCPHMQGLLLKPLGIGFCLSHGMLSVVEKQGEYPDTPDSALKTSKASVEPTVSLLFLLNTLR